jgi:hypothetical protein
MSVYSKKNAQTLVDRNGVDIAHSGKMMKRNPRSGKIITSDTTPLVDERTGEYNASNEAGLKEVLQAVLHMADAGDLTPNRPKPAFFDTSEWMEDGHLVKAAFDEKRPAEGGPWQVLGEVFSDDIYETMGRTAFADKVLSHQNVAEQGIARVRIHRMDVVAWAMVSDGHVAESFIKQKWVFPKGFDLDAHIVMQEAEIHEAGAQLLEEKYQDGLEAIMVREDRILKYLFDQAAQAPNDELLFASFTPTSFTTLRQQVWDWGIPVPHMVMAIDLMNDLFADKDWQGWYSPIEKHELAMEGRLGKLGDIEILTDGLRYSTLRVLNQGEVYFLGAPQNLGTKSLMIPLNSTVVDQRVVGRAVRGWFLLQREALTVANSRAVSKGRRQP